jgi:hypothetical protein
MDLPVIVLGLKNFSQKYIEVVNQLTRAGHRNVRVQLGIHGVEQPLALATAMKYWGLAASSSFSDGQLACTIANLSAAEYFLTGRPTVGLEQLSSVVVDDSMLLSSPYILIVEDDLVIPDNWSDVLPIVLASLPESDVVFLGWQWGSLPRSVPVYQMFFSAYPYCTHCYLLSRAGATKLVRLAKQYPLTCTIDTWIHNHGARLGIISSCVNPGALPALKYDRTAVSGHSDRGIAFQNSRYDTLVPVPWSHYGPSTLLVALILLLVVLGILTWIYWIRKISPPPR